MLLVFPNPYNGRNDKRHLPHLRYMPAKTPRSWLYGEIMNNINIIKLRMPWVIPKDTNILFSKMFLILQQLYFSSTRTIKRDRIRIEKDCNR